MKKEGKVKWFDQDRGYGFIRPFKKGPDVFVHITDVKESGYENLDKGDFVEYELQQGNDGKDRATEIAIFEYEYEDENPGPGVSKVEAATPASEVAVASKKDEKTILKDKKHPSTNV
jgi:cold shock protein